jgi:hypothetical protein
MPTSLLWIRKRTLLALAGAALLAGPGHAFSAEPLDTGQRTRIIQGGGTLDLQALDRNQRRQEFQQQQEQLRERDRQSNQQPQPSTTPAVPIFRPSGQ